MAGLLYTLILMPIYYFWVMEAIDSLTLNNVAAPVYLIGSTAYLVSNVSEARPVEHSQRRHHVSVRHWCGTSSWSLVVQAPGNNASRTFSICYAPSNFDAHIVVFHCGNYATASWNNHAHYYSLSGEDSRFRSLLFAVWCQQQRPQSKGTTVC